MTGSSSPWDSCHLYSQATVSLKYLSCATNSGFAFMSRRQMKAIYYAEQDGQREVTALR
jgi:hypothetical protein